MFSQVTFPRVLLAAALSIALGLTACGGGGSSGSSVTPPGGSSSTGTDCTAPKTSDVDGCAFVSLGDDTGDFLTYKVKVTDLSITRRDGTVAKLLPAATTVDFAQYTSLSEFLTLAAVPAGDYLSGSITLDFTGSDIEAQDASGNAVKLRAVGSSGKPLGNLTVAITLDADHPIGLFPGTPHVFGIDFDLNASSTINSNNTVTVDPFLVASVDSQTASSEEVRGSLSGTGTGSFTLGLQPFRGGSGDYGNVVVHSEPSTIYVVNQKVYFGTSGIAALAAAGNAPAVLVQGSFNFGSHRFVATQVMAGSSVPGGTKDAVEGVVISRSGNTLTLLGSTLYHTSHSVVFNDTAKVTLANSTAVRNIESPRTAGSIANISVGQRVLVFGKFDSATSSTLNAAGGFALLEFTDVDGSVLSLVDAGTNSSVNLDVQTIGGRPISMFDFTGTNSDPTNYEVALPCSCLNTGVNIGDPVIVSGFAAKFGVAPPDFNANALTDFNLADSVISATWPSGTANAFTSIEASSGIVVNLSSSPAVHSLREGAEVSDLNTLPSVPAVVTKDLGVFAILKGGNVQLFVNFKAFVSALNSDLSGGAKVKGFFAVGGYDSADSLLETTQVAVILK